MSLRLISTTLLLVQLDEAGIDVWANRKGWFWTGGKSQIANGPFPSAVKAGEDALKQKERAAA
jgi:hypothetical protein